MPFLIMLALSPLTSIIRGLVLCKLWDWFMVPSLGLPHLRIPFALGLSLIVNFLTFHYQKEEEKEPSEQIATYILCTVVMPIFVLGFGWIYTLFI